MHHESCIVISQFVQSQFHTICFQSSFQRSIGDWSALRYLLNKGFWYEAEEHVLSSSHEDTFKSEVFQAL